MHLAKVPPQQLEQRACARMYSGRQAASSVGLGPRWPSAAPLRTATVLSR